MQLKQLFGKVYIDILHVDNREKSQRRIQLHRFHLQSFVHCSNSLSKS